MKLSARVICLAAAIGFAALPLRARGDIVVQRPKYGYTVTLPPGWVRIPADVLDEHLKALGAVAKGKLDQKFTDGFQPAGTPWFQYPYIMVQVVESGPIPARELEGMKSFRSGVQEGLDEAKKKLPTMISDLSLGETAYDASNQCIWIRVSMQAAGVGEVKGVTRGFLTSYGMVTFNCYAQAQDFDQRLPVFNSLLANVKISDDMRYDPTAASHGSFDFSRAGRSGLIGGLIGGAVGLFMWLSKRKKSADGPPAA